MKLSILTIARHGLTIMFWSLALIILLFIFQETKQIFLGKEIFFSVDNAPIEMDKSVKKYFNEGERNLAFTPIPKTKIAFYYKNREHFWQDFSLFLAKEMQTFLKLFFSLFVIWQLKQIFDSVAKNQTFDLKNISRIRYIAFAEILISIFQKIISEFKLAEIHEIAVKSGYQLESPIHDFSLISDLFWGILILALAEIFKQGLKLKQENDLTI